MTTHRQTNPMGTPTGLAAGLMPGLPHWHRGRGPFAPAFTQSFRPELDDITARVVRGSTAGVGVSTRVGVGLVVGECRVRDSVEFDYQSIEGRPVARGTATGVTAAFVAIVLDSAAGE